MTHRYFKESTVKFFRFHNTVGKDPDEDDVEYWVSADIGLKIRERHGCTAGATVSNTCKASDVARVLYLDVGRWGGGGQAGSWDYTRFFGIVNGKSAYLCSYDETSKGGLGAPIWSKQAQAQENEPDGKRIAPLLRILGSDPHLGPVHVKKALTWPTPLAPTPEKEVIHVILGDLHLPVMTALSRTWSPNRSSSFGRYFLNPGKVQTLLTGLLGPTILVPDVLQALDKVFDSRLDDLSADFHDEMPEADAKAWFDEFGFGSAKAGADIFEGEAGAARDLIS